MMIFKNSATTAVSGITQHTLIAIGDAEEATGGLWLYYDVSRWKLRTCYQITLLRSMLQVVQDSPLTTMFADNTWQFIGLKREGNTLLFM